MDKLSDEDKTRITPTIFDTLQNIIQDESEQNIEKEKLLNRYRNIIFPEEGRLTISGVIWVLQELQNLSQTGKIVVEMDGLSGHNYYTCEPEQIQQLLVLPFNNCNFRISTDRKTIIIEPPGQYLWEICIIPLMDQTKELFSQYL